MRLFVYGMQSSGASTFCFFLGQCPNAIAIIDVWSRIVTPPIDSPWPIVAKATVTTTRSAADHIASFRPDKTILFIRDPVAIYESPMKYPYGNRFGSMEEKMVPMKADFTQGNRDAVIRAEVFVVRDPSVLSRINALGWPSAGDH